MAITYKWDISEMDAFIRAEGEDNVIYMVHWTYSGSEVSEEKEYSSSLIGAQNFEYRSGDPFIPYENTEAFENIVIDWLENALNVVELKSQIEAEIQQQKTPEEEVLFFTWQND